MKCTQKVIHFLGALQKKIFLIFLMNKNKKYYEKRTQTEKIRNEGYENINKI